MEVLMMMQSLYIYFTSFFIKKNNNNEGKTHLSKTEQCVISVVVLCFQILAVAHLCHYPDLLIQTSAKQKFVQNYLKLN